MNHDWTDDIQADENSSSNGHTPLHSEEIIQLIQGLAELNRLRIVNLLLHRDELCVCDIERVLDIPQTRISRHLSILRNARLVSARRVGRWMHYKLALVSVALRFRKRFFRAELQ